MENKNIEERRQSTMAESFDSETVLEQDEEVREFEEEEEEFESEAQIWDDVMSSFFPNAGSEEEIEEELDNMWND